MIGYGRSLKGIMCAPSVRLRFECPTPPSTKATKVEHELILQRDAA